MSNQSELAQLASVFAGSALSNRNVITNGDFIINQRGGATTNLTGGGVWFADRFFAQISGTSIVVSGSRSTDVPSGTTFSTSIKYDTTTAATATDHFTRLTTRIEGYEAKRIGVSTSGNKITLSFWVKSTRTGTHTVGLSTGYRGGTNYAQAGITLSYTINSASTWEYKSIAFDSYDTGGSAAWNSDNNIGLEIAFVAGQGSGVGDNTALDTWQDFASDDYVHPKSTSDNNNWGTSTSDEWFICGVQLEVGETATPFEHRNYGQELALCQRYFRKLKVNNANDYSFIRYNQNINSYLGNVKLLPPMRAAPTGSLTLVQPSNAIHKPSVRWDTVSSSTFGTSPFHVDLEISPSTNDGLNSIALYMYGYDIFADAEL